MHSTDGAVVVAVHMDDRSSGVTELTDGTLEKWCVGGRVGGGGRAGESRRWWIAGGWAFWVKAMSWRCNRRRKGWKSGGRSSWVGSGPDVPRRWGRVGSASNRGKRWFASLGGKGRVARSGGGSRRDRRFFGQMLFDLIADDGCDGGFEGVASEEIVEKSPSIKGGRCGRRLGCRGLCYSVSGGRRTRMSCVGGRRDIRCRLSVTLVDVPF